MELIGYSNKSIFKSIKPSYIYLSTKTRDQNINVTIKF